MGKKRVPLHQNPRGYVDVDPDATDGAQVGVNLRGPDGQILTAEQVINPTTGGSGGPSSIASTIWKLIREIPLNIQKLAVLIGAGFAARQSNGDWALRTLQEGTGIDIVNPDGDAGNPTIGLADAPDSGAGTLLAITRDGKGRVTGTKSATITGTAQQIDVANGSAAAGPPTISLSDLPNSGAGAALVKITRDAKGRVSGTQAASTTDLAEGTNLYYTDTRADDRIAAQKGQPNGIADLDAGGKIPSARLPAIDHNNLSGLQGGTSGERYHLTAAQLSALSTYAIDANVVHKTGTETIGGNKTFSDLVLINNALTVDRSGIGTMSLTAPGGAAPGFIIRRTASGSLYRSEIRGQDGRLQLGTNPTAGADAAPSKFFEIWDDSIRSTADNSISAGTAAFRFTQVFAVNGAISTSDARLKTEPRKQSDAERKVGSALAREPMIWEWLTGDRLHAGPTVQAAIAVMKAHGLDPFAYSFICYDEWEAQPEQWHEWPAEEAVYEEVPDSIYGENGTVLAVHRTKRVLVKEAVEAGRELVQAAREAGDRYSFRKEELLCFMVSSLAAENDLQAAKVAALDARLAALEAKA